MNHEITPIDYRFTGEYQPKINLQRHNYAVETDDKDRPCLPYKSSEALRHAVELSLNLQIPLLLEGPPGSGKTQLAQALRYELTYRNFLDSQTGELSQWWPYYRWDIKSTSQVADELYEYDGIGRIRDAQLMGSNPKELEVYLGQEQAKKLRERLLDPSKYYKERAIGKAFLEEQYRPIVLIDEIDKAGRDFPNNLLSLIDERQFSVMEFQREPVVAKQTPILIFTSNREKPLPEPFLRRCVYYFVERPSVDDLIDIVKSRHQFDANYEALVKRAACHLDEIWRSQQASTGRSVGLSEFLDFMRALLAVPPKDAATILENLATDDKHAYLSLLLKSESAQNKYREQFRQES